MIQHCFFSEECGEGCFKTPTAPMKCDRLVDREGEILQSVLLQISTIGQGLQGTIQSGFQVIVTLAEANAHANTEVFLLVDLRTDKFKSRAVLLAEKPEVGLHGIGHDHIGSSIHQVEIECFIGIV